MNMSNSKNASIIKKLLDSTTKKTVWTTVNLLLVATDARPGFYDDSDRGGFSALPERYKEIVIEFCSKFNLKITIIKDRYLVSNTKNPIKGIPLNTKEMGEFLGFPCPAEDILNAKWRKTQHVYTLVVHTEFDSVTFLTGFMCNDNLKVEEWYKKIKNKLLKIAPLFKQCTFSLIKEDMN
jgi:hypothetical protein